MNPFHPTVVLASAFCLCLPAAAQVAPGEGLMTTIQGTTPGLAVIDVPGTGNMALVSGLPSQVREFSSCVIDPVTGELWLTGFEGSGYRVMRVSLSGSTVSSFTSFADLSGQPKGSGQHTGFSGIDLDRDGNLFVCDNSNIWKVERSSGAVTHWATGTTAWMNDLTIDRETNTMWSVELEGFDPGAEIRTFDIDAGPSVGTQLLDLTTVPFETSASAITFDGQSTLYVGTWGPVFSVDVNTGLTQAMDVAGAGVGYNSLDFDRVTGALHTGGSVFGSTVYALVDPVSLVGTAINNDLECIWGSVPGDSFCTSATLNSAVDVNDFLHTTQMFPRSASVSAGFKLEVSANGMPGDFAVIAVGEINGMALASPIVLGTYGTCGLGGNFLYSTDVPSGALPGFISSLGIGTATYDFASGVFSYGGVETLNLVP